VLQSCEVEISREEGDGVFVADGALVPVLWDAFVAWVVLKVAVVVAGDGEEGLENFFVEDALGVFGGFVGHEPVDEGVCCWLDCDAGERRAEEVGVGRFGLGDAFGAEVVKEVEVVVCGGVGDAGLLGVESLELR